MYEGYSIDMGNLKKKKKKRSKMNFFQNFLSIKVNYFNLAEIFVLRLFKMVVNQSAPDLFGISTLVGYLMLNPFLYK